MIFAYLDIQIYGDLSKKYVSLTEKMLHHSHSYKAKHTDKAFLYIYVD